MSKNVKEKILVLLLAGLVLGASRNRYHHQWARKAILQELALSDSDQEKEARKEVRNLYRSKLIKEVKNADGSFTLVLSRKGRLKALTYFFNNIKISHGNWDKKWRLVFFDVPEKFRFGRDSLRKKLKELGFYEIQKSIFAFPYDCEDEIDFIIEYYGIRKFVRHGVLESIDDDVYLRKFFSL